MKSKKHLAAVKKASKKKGTDLDVKEVIEVKS
jgi:hypothetical protein